MKKILYLLSGVGVAVGVGIMLFSSTTMGGFVAIAGVALAALTFVGGKLIDASVGSTFDANPTNGNMSVEMKINQAIAESRQNKFKAESEIRRLTAWSNDAILSAYSQLFDAQGVMMEKEKLLANYDQIKEQYGSQLTFETEDKCDQIVKGYRQKIDGYKQRIEIFEKKQAEYTQLKEKMKEVRQNEKRLKQLDRHQQKLENAENSEIQSLAAVEANQLTMGDLEKEVAQREEYYKQLEQLEYQYKS